MCPTGDASRHVCRGEACLARRAAWRGKTAVCTSAPRRACHPGDRRTAAVRVPAAAGRPHRARRRPTPDPRRTRAGAGGVRGWQIEHRRRNTRARARPVKPARRRAAHRAVDHPLDHQQEEGPLGPLTHKVGSHHTRSVHDTARPRIQRVVVQPVRSCSQPPGGVPSHHRPLVHAAEFAAPRARPGNALRRPYRAMPSIPDRAWMGHGG